MTHLATRSRSELRSGSVQGVGAPYVEPVSVKAGGPDGHSAHQPGDEVARRQNRPTQNEIPIIAWTLQNVSSPVTTLSRKNAYATQHDDDSARNHSSHLQVV